MYEIAHLCGYLNKMETIFEIVYLCGDLHKMEAILLRYKIFIIVREASIVSFFEVTLKENDFYLIFLSLIGGDYRGNNSLH